MYSCGYNFRLPWPWKKSLVFVQTLFIPLEAGKCLSNRSRVQGSTFSAASGHRSCQFDQKSDAGLAESHTRVKDKERIEDPKSSLKMSIFPSNCQFGSIFWIRPDEDDAFLMNTQAKCSPGTRMEPWTPEPLNPWTATCLKWAKMPKVL